MPCRVERAVPRVLEGVFLVSARCGSASGAVLHAPHEDAAEGTEDFMHNGRVCCVGLRLGVDGGLRLLDFPNRYTFR